MNAEQKKHLRSRINDAAREHLYSRKARKEPVSVRRARAIIRVFNDKVNRVSETHRNRVSKAEAKVRQIVLFGEAEDALAAVVAFEKQSFRRK